MKSYCLTSLLYACEMWSLNNISAHNVNVALNNSLYNKINKTHRFSDAVFECHAHFCRLQRNFEALQWSAAALQNLRVKLSSNYIEALSNLTRPGCIIASVCLTVTILRD